MYLINVDIIVDKNLDVKVFFLEVQMISSQFLTRGLHTSVQYSGTSVIREPVISTAYNCVVNTVIMKYYA